MKCDCCYREKEVNQYGELIVCEDCSKKVRKCPLCGQYYFSFEGMPIVCEGKEIEVCYECYLEN